MAPGVPGRLSVPLIFGTIDGAGIPPIAALSPGTPSSGGESNAPAAQSGCRQPNISHAGSSWTKAGVAFAGTAVPSTASPAIPAAAVLASARRILETVICYPLTRLNEADRCLPLANIGKRTAR
jgi:hypothetical protein